MVIDGCVVMLDACGKYFRSLRIAGFAVPSDGADLTEVALIGAGVIAQRAELRRSHPADATHGGARGFALDVFLEDDVFPETAALRLVSSSGAAIVVLLTDLIYERLSAAPTFDLYRRLLETTQDPAFRRILDIGGRARSQIDRRTSFPGCEVTVLDILPGENVDIVADAHDLTAVIAPESFDLVHSVSVFEHLAVPWRVVLEINRVLRPGGLVFVHTHQTLGLHDVPADFWRMSGDAWPSLFNEVTGFALVETAVSHENFVLPHFWRPDKRDAEQAAGHEVSCALARKVGPPRAAWPLARTSETAPRYPDGVESDPHGR